MPYPGNSLRRKGSNVADTLEGCVGDDHLRGRGGDDLLTGGDGDDIFVFERTATGNGTDRITDYQWDESGTGDQDILNLSAALKRFTHELESDPGADITHYVRLETSAGGAKLMVDPDGNDGDTQWALLEGLSKDDTVRIKAFGRKSHHSEIDLGDGYYTLSIEESAPRTIFVVPGQPGADDSIAGSLYLDDGDGVFGSGWDARVNWQSTPPENFSVGDDTLLADLSGVDFDSGTWIVKFLSPGQGQSLWVRPPKGPPTIDLSGFGSDDSIVIDFSQMQYWPDNGGGTTWGYKWISVSGSNSYTGWYLNSRSIFAGEYFGPLPAGKNDFTSVYKDTKLASWSAGTTIVGSQISVLWPVV